MRDRHYHRIAREQGDVPILSEEDREASRRAFFRHLMPGDAVWVFAYGSLIWNPAFHFAERMHGRIHGYHRAFCMWTRFGRGTPDNPGLMLGLDRGGSCAGLVYRIAPEEVEPETEILWAREMFSGTYDPRWVNVRTDDGTVQAVAFVVDRRSPQYTGPLSTRQMADTIATACGRIGPCVDYLRALTESLDAWEIADGTMHTVRRLVETRLAADTGTP